VELWTDPNCAATNRMRVPKLEPLLGMRGGGAAPVAEAAVAAPAFPQAVGIFTLEPSSPLGEQAAKEPRVSSSPVKSQLGGQPTEEHGRGVKREVTKPAGVARTAPAADGRSASGNGSESGGGEMEVYLRGRAGLGKDYRVCFTYQISIW